MSRALAEMREGAPRACEETRRGGLPAVSPISKGAVAKSRADEAESGGGIAELMAARL